MSIKLGKQTTTNKFPIDSQYLHNNTENKLKTRRLAACTQAVVILRSTSYIAIS